MPSIFNYNNIPLLCKVDILIIGAGSAGCVAALAAAHAKKYAVMIVERYGFPGGTSTQMLDTFYGFFTPGSSPRKIVGGIADRIVDELDKTGDIFLRPNTYGAGTGVNYNPEKLKQVWDQQLITAGVRYLLHTTLVDVNAEAESVSCICWNKGGFHKIEARRVIDASGDADFSYLAGYRCEIAGENEPAQSMTTTFRMCNVDLKKFEAAGGNKMMKAKMSEAYKQGTHPLPRKEGSAHEMCQPSCISTVAVKVTDLSALKAEDLTMAEVEGRKQSFIFEQFFRDKIPGYENAQIIGLSNQIGVRETRRVYGKHRLTKEECLRSEIPDSSIFLCGAPIEDHRKGADGESETHWEYIPGVGIYGVPYGTIVPKGSNLSWVAGRCFSATHDAHASCRSMAQTMSMGMAAGFAAVQSLEKDFGAADVDVKGLRMQLNDIGQILEIPGQLADIRRDGWANNTNANRSHQTGAV